MLHLCRRPSFPHRRHTCRRARSAHGVIGLLLALALGCGCAPARADWEITTEAGGQYDDNLTRAQDAVDKRAAGAAIVGVSGLSVTPWTGSDAIILALYGRAEIYDRYSGLSNATLGGNLAYRHKFGVGYAAPWVSVAVDGSYDNYRDNLRTGTRLDVRAETGRRLDQQADVAAGVYFERRYDNHGESIVPGIPGDVFALAGVGAYARGGYAFTNGLYVGVAASVRRGDVESTAQQSLQIFLASDAIAEDPVWGDPELYAYRLRGTTLGGALTASYAFSDNSSLNASYRYDLTHAAQDLQYTSNAVRLTFAYRF